MNRVRECLWKLLAAGMIPFVLGAGLPQMECRCAAANGRRFSECCFRKANEVGSRKTSLKRCCRNRLASRAGETREVLAVTSSAGCPTCQQFKNSPAGSCCRMKLAEAPTLAQQVELPDLHDVPLRLPLSVFNANHTLTFATCEDDWSRVCCSAPPLDRVIVFEHLLI